MNTEINFLNKQTKTNIAPLFIGIIVFILSVILFGTLLFQKNTLANQLDQQHETLGELETLIIRHQKDTVGVQKLQQLQRDVDALESDMLPHVQSYKEVLGILPSSNQFVSYQLEETNQIVITAEFPSLDEVAANITKLMEFKYITDINSTDINHTGSTYQATLTIDLNYDILAEGDGGNNEAVDEE